MGNYSNNNKLQLNGNYSNDNYSLSESEQSKINRFLMRQNQTVNFEDNAKRRKPQNNDRNIEEEKYETEDNMDELTNDLINDMSPNEINDLNSLPSFALVEQISTPL